MIRKIKSQLLCWILAVYLLGIHEGKIALWSSDDPEPARVFPYSASTLPKEARDALERGIPINSMEDLNRLIEAYLS